MQQRIWQLSSGSAYKDVQSLEQLESALYASRGLSEESAASFLHPQYARDIHNPHLLHGMREAVDRIYEAVNRRERILVYGDYDADGVTSTAIMMATLADIGAHAMPYLPHRIDDGYGLNQSVIESLCGEFDLLITVDCGVSNAGEIAWLRERGKDTIVVDHHELPDRLPDSVAVLHPRHPKGEYPWPSLCGAGVSWKLAQALLRDGRSPFAQDPDKEKWLLDFVMLGTIGDIMPLLGENRAIVSFGMEVLRRSKRPGLRVLADYSRIDMNSFTVKDIAFRVVPMINAAGRIDHPQAALDVLLAATPEQAARGADKLVGHNKKRQSVARQVKKEAEQVIDHASPVVFAANVNWHPGIVGLVAGQIASQLSRPAIIVGGNGRHAVGSARSVAGVNILAMLKAAERHVLRLGGHAEAAGFSLLESSLSDLQEAVCAYAHAQDFQTDAGQVLFADAVLDHSLLTWETHARMQQFAPFGEANPEPLFIMRNVPVLQKRTIGKTKNHLRALFAFGDQEIGGIGFGMAEAAEVIGEQVDILGSLEVNEFRGNRSLQLHMKDIAPAGSVVIQEEEVYG